MNWTWVSSLDQLWDSSAFPMWLTLVSAGFFGIILFITILRAEKSGTVKSVNAKAGDSLAVDAIILEME